MKSIVGKYIFSIDAYLTDFGGQATLSMLGGFMLQAATKHAEERGFGFSSMTEQKRAWVLSRMAIEIFEYPKNDTEITIYTWVKDVNKLFTERCFAFRNAEGKNIGYARSVWASIDLETRRPTNVLEHYGLIDYVNKDEPCPIEGMRKIPPIKDVDPVGNFVVKYSDVDINKHLNSMKYIEHFIDLFDLEMFRTKEIRRFEINYIAEAHYGSTICLLKKEEQEAIFTLEMKDGESIVSAARVTWDEIEQN
ncbi:acyl-[acyl-carrier-protein] thioesterase [Viscerimonas tarda]